VYKFLKRNQSLLVFSPTKIVLDDITFNDGVAYGIVLSRSEDLFFRTEVTDEWLHSIVLTQPGVYQGFGDVKRINPANNEERSALAWEFLLEEVKREVGEDVSLKKSEFGYPVVIRDGKELDIVISLSHDGDFAAYSMRI
jgi:hypothetical protein